jgi:hypothetical protein
MRLEIVVREHISSGIMSIKPSGDKFCLQIQEADVWLGLALSLSQGFRLTYAKTMRKERDIVSLLRGCFPQEPGWLLRGTWPVACKLCRALRFDRFGLLFAFGLGFLADRCEGAAGELAWEQGEGYRMAALAVPTEGKTGFTLLTREETGILFVGQLSYERALQNQNLMNGAGLAAGDYDGDGWCDLYFCNLDGTNALYRNLGNWKFANVTELAGVGFPKHTSHAAVFAFLNGDKAVDLLVSANEGPPLCLMNDGRGHFKDVAREAGMVSDAGGHSLALADVDGDGDLDVYLANYGVNTILRGGGTVAVRMVNGKPVISGRLSARLRIVDGQLIEMGEPDVLYLNDGLGRFTPVSWTAGAFLDEEGKPLRKAPQDMGLSAIFRDINADGSPDLYVCNDFQNPDRIWLNDGTGKFRALPALALRSTCHFSMCIDFADIDRDGLDDFAVGDMLSRSHTLRMTQINISNPRAAFVEQNIDRHQVNRNTLFLNRGDGTYAEIAQYAGTEASDWTWAIVFLDVDLDGYEDLLVANGNIYDTLNLDMMEKSTTATVPTSSMRGGKQLKDYPPLPTPNFLFRNRGDRTFEEVGAQWGYHSTNVSHGICLADLDNDGDQDVVLNGLWNSPLVYRNDTTAPRLPVRLRGKAPNLHGIGAKIRVLGGPVPQQQEIICGGRYASADDPMRVFAAGSLTNRLTIEVTWRAGTRSVVSNALPNRLYEIDEAGAQPMPKPGAPPASPQPVFEDVSDTIRHTHGERSFDDLAQQPLLHRSLSTPGPGIAWSDLDGDGHEDLIIGTGRGGALAVYRNNGQGTLTQWTMDGWKSPLTDDTTGLAAWTPQPGRPALLAGLSDHESGPAKQAALLIYYPSQAVSETLTFPGPDDTGPLAVADWDGDGDLDVFAGGRPTLGHYPTPASSLILENLNGKLRVAESASSVLKNVGLVNGAVWSDLDGDGWPDLVLACEWGPVRVFANQKGQLRERTSDWGLATFTGWWQGVTTGDFDGDGRLDIVASNWGLNSTFAWPPHQPIHMYYGDLDSNGTVDLIEAYTDPASGKVVPRRNLTVLGPAVPLMRVWYPKHASFAEVDIPTILAKANIQAGAVQANTLASTLFLNRGDRFEAHPLPEQAQYAPAFAANVADLDGDGFEDLFLSQNFFPVRQQDSRLDSGRGLWLRGDANGRLTPVAGQVSGILVYGEQRGAALADFNEDGRVDLVISQNGAATKLYNNRRAKPGLRIRLLGPAANPHGIGAALRLVAGGKPGPVREIHAGSGYWSQDSPVQVLSLPEPADSLWIRWPGGKITTHPLPAKAQEIAAAISGDLKVLR